MMYYGKNPYGIRNPFNGIENLISNAANSMITRAISIAGDKMKAHYGYDVFIRKSRFGKAGLDVANNWIKKYDPKYKERLGSLNSNLVDTEFIITLDYNTCAMVVVGKNSFSEIDVLKSMISEKGDRNGGYSDDDIYLFIFGKYAEKYKAEIENRLSKISEGLYVYNVSGGSGQMGDRDEFNSIVSEMHQRQMDTLFFNPGVKEKILHHIDSFLENENVYKQRDLLYKTGIMMFGEPGTGKSSLANAIATHYKSSLIIIDMNTFAHLDTVALSQSINADDDRYVILLEDIDCIFNSLNREGEETADKDEKKIINKLLQFLDSNSSPNNVIFLATTNHIEKLDSYFDQAIMRAGRFDERVEISGINREVAAEMCRSFELPEEKIQAILDNEPEFPVNQSHLQKMILASIEGKKPEEIEESTEESTGDEIFEEPVDEE